MLAVKVIQILQNQNSVSFSIYRVHDDYILASLITVTAKTHDRKHAGRKRAENIRKKIEYRVVLCESSYHCRKVMDEKVGGNHI